MERRETEMGRVRETRRVEERTVEERKSRREKEKESEERRYRCVKCCYYNSWWMGGRWQRALLRRHSIQAGEELGKHLYGRPVYLIFVGTIQFALCGAILLTIFFFKLRI